MDFVELSDKEVEAHFVKHIYQMRPGETVKGFNGAGTEAVTIMRLFKPIEDDESFTDEHLDPYGFFDVVSSAVRYATQEANGSKE